MSSHSSVPRSPRRGRIEGRPQRRAIEDTEWMSRVGSWARAWLEGWAARLREPIRRAGAFALDSWTHYSRHIGLVLAVGLAYLGLVQGRAAPAWLFQPVRLPQAASAQPASPEVLQALLRRSAYLGGTRRNSPALLIRQVDLHTEIPERPRRGIITYTVQSGDTLFGIAEKFKLRPETILWANYDVLQDDPHMLEIGQVLNIPPVDGVLHVVKEGETLEAIAQKYNVSPEAIRNAEWNGLQDGGEPQVGQVLIVPGGTRPFAGWTPPRQAYVVVAGGKRLPSGACPSVQVPPLGTGSFIWPVNSRWRSGYDFTAYHPGVDFAGRLGDPVYAADAGTVVYAGWSTVGYGNLIVLDHGNGYQTYYAHLSAIFVGCGQQVAKGATIGLVGSTGRSTGPHLHFEIRGPGGFVNPWRALP